MKNSSMIIYSAIAVTGILVTLSVTPIIHFSTMRDVQFEVTKSERVTNRVGESVVSKYLVYTDTETFQNTDSLLSLKFNSSDMYGKMRVGMKCTATVNGFRVPFMSWYRNIIKVKECAS